MPGGQCLRCGVRFLSVVSFVKAALSEMRFPGMLCVAMPVTVGLVFRWVGSVTGRPMLGAEVRGRVAFRDRRRVNDADDGERDYQSGGDRLDTSVFPVPSFWPTNVVFRGTWWPFGRTLAVFVV